MEHDESAAAPRGVPRRAVLRGAAWTAPVVLATVAAPAMAASVGPLTITGAKFLTTIAFTFTGGQSNLPVTVLSVTTKYFGTTYTINTSPDSVTSVGGTTYGGLLTGTLITTLNYTISYSFNGTTYTSVVAL